jgi:hypothetical protein
MEVCKCNTIKADGVAVALLKSLSISGLINYKVVKYIKPFQLESSLERKKVKNFWLKWKQGQAVLKACPC